VIAEIVSQQTSITKDSCNEIEQVFGGFQLIIAIVLGIEVSDIAFDCGNKSKLVEETENLCD
jgi:hypothetical protein